MALYIENEIVINASPQQVWQALVDPSVTPKYMFGCEVLCDWQPGSPILWKGVADGVVYVKGDLVSFEKPKKFAFTVFDPNAKYEDIPINYLTATYTLEEQNSGTLLKVSQGDYQTVAEGQQRYDDTLAQGGWAAVLQGIKQVVES